MRGWGSISGNILYVSTILSIIPSLSPLPSFLPSFLLRGGQNRGKVESWGKRRKLTYISRCMWVNYRFAQFWDYAGNETRRLKP